MDAHETSLFTAIFIACVVIGAIFSYFLIIIIRNQRRSQELYKSKILAEITTLEKERARIAIDLHDELGPYLSVTKFRINALDIVNEEDNEHLVKINENIDLIIKRMREIAADLMPNTLIRKGVVVAIEEFVHKIVEPELTIQFMSKGSTDYPVQMGIHIYRIVQEIIHNTIKHARATELKIEIRREENKLVLLTQDNGTGFDYNNVLYSKNGLGLRSLLSRIEVLGGEMFIESRPGKGTSYVFECSLSI